MAARVGLRGSTLTVEDGGEISHIGAVLGDPVDHVFLCSPEGAGSASLASLRSTLIRVRDRLRRRSGFSPSEAAREKRLWIGFLRSEEELHRVREEGGEWMGWTYPSIPPTSPAVFLEGERLRLRISFWKEEKPDARAARRLLDPFSERQSATYEISISPLDDDEVGGFVFSADFDRAHVRGATLGDFWRLGDEAQTLLHAAEEDELPQAVALDLLSAGRWDLFKGQPETGWLEAKRVPYDPLDGNWRFELAKDVAAFANAPGGGFIVLGMITRDRGDGDVIEGHKEFDLRRVKAATYRGHVARHVYPRVQGFEVRRIRGREKGKGLAVLIIPPQPESSRPFLVQGTVSERKVLGAHVLLPTRREDDTALLDAGAIHARIRLGERAIAGES